MKLWAIVFAVVQHYRLTRLRLHSHFLNSSVILNENDFTELNRRIGQDKTWIRPRLIALELMHYRVQVHALSKVPDNRRREMIAQGGKEEKV